MPKNNTTAQKDKRQKAQRKIPKRISESYLHNAGLYYLQRFAASTGQFRKVMQRKITRSCAVHTDQDETECREKLETLIAKFQEIGLLNDEEYTRSIVASHRRRGLSERAITAKLRSKGIDPALIKKHVEANETSDFSAALKLCRRKRIGPFASPLQTTNAAKPDDPQKTYEKSMAKLARAGFGYDIAKAVLDLPPEEAEERLYDAM